MSREWQQTQLMEYVMPHAVYYQTIWAVRDLDRMENRLEELTKRKIQKSMGDNAVRESVRFYNRSDGSRVDSQAMETAVLQERVDGIHNAMKLIPEKYRGTILNNIIDREHVSIYVDREWKAWKQKFLFMVAKNLSIM